MNTPDEKIVTRFAPSPTGVLHIGGARTALYNFLFAKKNNGKFILRIEDTDKERSKKEYEKNILESLSWLNISYDEIFYQSERANIHKKYLQKMLENKTVYEGEDSKDGTGKIIRFKNTNEKITFTDIVRGEISFDTTELGDFVIAKNIDTPLFHLAVVADDFDMGVTHIIRGEDHISNTQRQILIQRAIGAVEPKYGHIPLILADDRSKLSKRHGAVSVTEYKEKGYLPEALINFMALIGWNPGDNKEIFNINELTSVFSLDKIQKSGAMFNMEKLNWINKEHIKKLPEEEVEKIIENYLITSFNGIDAELLKKLTPIILERINVFSDIHTLIKEGELDYFFKVPTDTYDLKKLVWKDETLTATKQHMKKIIELLEESDFKNIENIKDSIWDYADKEGRGNVLWPMRYTLSGKDKSPDPFTLAYVLGKKETIARLKAILL